MVLCNYYRVLYLNGFTAVFLNESLLSFYLLVIESGFTDLLDQESGFEIRCLAYYFGN